MKNKVIGALVFTALIALPGLALAQSGQLSNVTTLVRAVKNIIDLLIPLVAALALLYFFWGLAKFILAAGDEEAREKGKSMMIWGIVALFIIVAVWGIVRFMVNALGLDTPQSVPIPGVPDN